MSNWRWSQCLPSPKLEPGLIPSEVPFNLNGPLTLLWNTPVRLGLHYPDPDNGQSTIPSWGSLVYGHIFLVLLLPFSAGFPIMLSNMLQGGRWSSAQALQPSWYVFCFINARSWHGNTTVSNEEERLLMPPNFKHLSFISPSFLYS